MTTEEKAKAYDEALERAKAAMDMAADKDLVGGVVRTILPELAETEDERIRKQIVNIINHLGEGIIPIPENQEELLAYLEKQKEQKFTEKQDYSNLTDLERAIHRGFLSAGVENVPVTIIEETAQECPAQIKPAEIDEYEIIKKHITEDSLSSEVNKRLKECGWYVTYEKPAEWSEEDKRMIDNIIYCLPGMATGTIEMLPSLAKQYALRLKSLFPSWKPSEQEKAALRTAIHILTEERNFPRTGAQLQNILNAFEGKESRKDWKPSEEQMEALKEASASWMNEKMGNAKILESLYEQLKKL